MPEHDADDKSLVGGREGVVGAGTWGLGQARLGDGAVGETRRSLGLALLGTEFQRRVSVLFESGWDCEKDGWEAVGGREGGRNQGKDSETG